MKEEQQIQIAVCEFCHLHKIPFIHVANERKANPIYGRLLKRMGVLAGVSDCFLPRGNDKFKGAWLEIKTLKGKPSITQMDFLNSMIAEGYFGMVCYGVDESLLAIKNFYGMK